MDRPASVRPTSSPDSPPASPSAIPGLSAVILTAGDFDRDHQEAAADLAAARQADLVAVEDVHRLSARAVEAVVQLLDRGLARQVQLVFTAAVGPAQMERLPARLTSRLAGGLIVGLEPLAPASRLNLSSGSRRPKGADTSIRPS